jgi:hypothetical protein
VERHNELQRSVMATVAVLRRMEDSHTCPKFQVGPRLLRCVLHRDGAGAWLMCGRGRQGMFDTILSDSRLKALLESVSAEADACCGV